MSLGYKSWNKNFIIFPVAGGKPDILMRPWYLKNVHIYMSGVWLRHSQQFAVMILVPGTMQCMMNYSNPMKMDERVASSRS